MDVSYERGTDVDLDSRYKNMQTYKAIQAAIYVYII